MSEVTKNVELTRIVKPKFISLVKSPANQVAFKIVRDDTGEHAMPHIQRKRTKRSAPLVAISFSAAESDDDIKRILGEWGVEEFSIEDREDGLRVARCNDAEGPTINIRLNDGRVATILKPISNQPDEKHAIAVRSVEFASDYFPDAEDISAWCTRNGIDFSQDAVENGDQQTVVRRAAVEEGEETRKIEVDAGVQFVVVRAETADIPENYVAVVNDAAFGSWGWGQLDFAATLADIAFCEVSQEAVYVLNRVVERILFYSDLPVALRKSLLADAAGQFAEFIGTLMDALPARVVVANRSIVEKEKLMSKENQNVQAVEQRQDADKGEESKGGETTEQSTTESISRADVEKMIGEAVGGLSAQLTALTESVKAAAEAAKPVQREDDKSGTPAAENKEPESKPDAGLQEVLRSIKEIGDTVKGIGDRVQSLEGSTVVRSDGKDDEQKPTQRKDVFRGMFGGGSGK